MEFTGWNKFSFKMMRRGKPLQPLTLLPPLFEHEVKLR